MVNNTQRTWQGSRRLIPIRMFWSTWNLFKTVKVLYLNILYTQELLFQSLCKKKVTKAQHDGHDGRKLILQMNITTRAYLRFLSLDTDIEFMGSIWDPCQLNRNNQLLNMCGPAEKKPWSWIVNTKCLYLNCF